MTNLTEQWKKGELPDGWYYVRCAWSDEVEIRYVHNGVDDWQEIIAEVPSFEEYQKLLSDQLAKNEGEEINAELEHRLAMVKANGNYPDRISKLKSRVVALSEENANLNSKLQLKETAYDFDTARLEEENAQLKEQLKECELWFTGVVGNMNDKNVGEHNRNLPIGNFEHVFKVFSQKINQVLGEE